MKLLILTLFLTQNFLFGEDDTLGNLELAELRQSGGVIQPKKSSKANGGYITYGAEKEGFDYRIVNVAGPNSRIFSDYIYWLDKSLFSSNIRTKFLRKFFKGMYERAGKSSYKVYGNVIDNKGKNLNLDDSEFIGKNYDEMSGAELWSNFSKWVKLTHNSPFSYIKPQVRRDIIEGKFVNTGRNGIIFVMEGYFKNWVPIFGKAQDYIEDTGPARLVDVNYYGHPRGWEVNFKPQNSYGKYLKMISWFKKVMNQQEASLEYQSPGHQRVVFPETQFSKDEVGKENEYLGKMGEFFKMAQAFVVLRGLQGKTGISTSKYKKVLSDKSLAKLSTGKGVLKLERGRWGKDTMAVEFRAGTKDDKIIHFLMKVLGARVGDNNWSGLKASKSWELISPYLANMASVFPFQYLKAIGTIVENTGLGYIEVTNFITHMSNLKNKKDRQFKLSFLVFLWNWDDAPFLSKEKKTFIKGLTQSLVRNVNKNIKKMKFSDLEKLIQDWVKVTIIDKDIENYMRPKSKKISDLALLSSSTGPVNVNNIDMGIEFSSRFDVSPRSKYERVGGINEKMYVTVDLNEKERADSILKLARTLSKKLGGTKPHMNANTGGHGHGLSQSASFRDRKDNKWTVEWDGIGRLYKSSGEIIYGSESGGHMELVSPRFVPDSFSINSVLESYRETGFLPLHKFGGGHHNIDLTPFENRPKAFARFVALSHRYSSIMSALFQDINRRKAAEPYKISTNLYKKLLKEDWTKESLSQELYNSGHFNKRRGRKTRYLWMDISAYYQHVIPPEYLVKDFDIKSPQSTWHRQFRVHPKILKAEFRMFNAPKNQEEIGLSIKLIRSILNLALNKTEIPKGELTYHSLETLIKDPNLALKILKKMTTELKLPNRPYKYQLAKALNEGREVMKSKFFKPLDSVLKSDTIVQNWLPATKLRKGDEVINSEDHSWDPKKADAKDIDIQKQKEGQALLANKIRLLLEISQIGETDHRCLRRLNEDYPSFMTNYSLVLDEFN